MPRTDVVFYQDDDENQTVLIHQWMKTLPAKVQDKCQAYLGQLEDFGHELRRPVADYLRDGIHELRPSYQGVHYRMLYFLPRRESSSMDTPDTAVVSHGFVKEGVVPDAEINRAIARRRAFEKRPERHTFRPTLKR